MTTRYAWPAFRTPQYSISDDELRALVAAGFDFVRLTIDPSIFIEATGENAAQIQQHAKNVVRQLLAQNLDVIVDLHPVAVNPAYDRYNLVRDIAAPPFQAYAAMVTRMAALFDGLPPTRVALELLNEPMVNGKGPADLAKWQAMLELLHARARAGSATLPLVLTGAWGSAPEALPLLNLEPFRGSNVTYTFHYYEPYAFTHQGTRGLEPQCIMGLNWPEDEANAEAVLARAQGCIAAAPLDAAQRDQLGKDTLRLIEGYKRRRFSPADAARAFDTVGRWAADNGIASSRILVGEFGCVSAAPVGPNGSMRSAWLSNVVTQAERHGFAWSYWAYKGQGGMSLVEDGTATLDPQTVTALRALSR